MTSWQSLSQEITSLLRNSQIKPCSQEPATGPYPEPDASNPLLTALFP